MENPLMDLSEICCNWYNIKNLIDKFVNMVDKTGKLHDKIRNKFSYFFIDLINTFQDEDNIVTIMKNLDINQSDCNKLYEMINKLVSKTNIIISDEKLKQAFDLFKNYNYITKVTYKFTFSNGELIISILNRNLKIKMYQNYIELYNRDPSKFISSFLLYDTLDLNLEAGSIIGHILDEIKLKYNPTFEGFSHPFNSLFGNRFCSRYYKYEKIFGSIGNFFDTDLTEINDSCVLVNPPYTENVLNSAADVVIDTLERADKIGKKMTFVMMYPNWGDDNIIGCTPVRYEKVLNCKYLIERIKIDNTRYSYLDHINQNITKPYRTFKVIYILTNK